MTLQQGNLTGTHVESALAGSPLAGNVYFNPSYVNTLSAANAAALLMHESLHTLGLTDTQVEDALHESQPSDNITQKFKEDCFQ
jgi:predicted metal-dependent peptidase